MEKLLEHPPSLTLDNGQQLLTACGFRFDEGEEKTIISAEKSVRSLGMFFLFNISRDLLFAKLFFEETGYLDHQDLKLLGSLSKHYAVRTQLSLQRNGSSPIPPADRLDSKKLLSRPDSPKVYKSSRRKSLYKGDDSSIHKVLGEFFASSKADSSGQSRTPPEKGVGHSPKTSEGDRITPAKRGEKVAHKASGGNIQDDACTDSDTTPVRQFRMDAVVSPEPSLPKSVEGTLFRPRLATHSGTSYTHVSSASFPGIKKKEKEKKKKKKSKAGETIVDRSKDKDPSKLVSLNDIRRHRQSVVTPEQGLSAKSIRRGSLGSSSGGMVDGGVSRYLSSNTPTQVTRVPSDTPSFMSTAADTERLPPLSLDIQPHESEHGRHSNSHPRSLDSPFLTTEQEDQRCGWTTPDNSFQSFRPFSGQAGQAGQTPDSPPVIPFEGLRSLPEENAEMNITQFFRKATMDVEKDLDTNILPMLHSPRTGACTIVEWSEEMEVGETLSQNTNTLVEVVYVGGFQCVRKKVILLSLANKALSVMDMKKCMRELEALTSLPPHKNIVQYLHHTLDDRELSLYLCRYSTSLHNFLSDCEREENGLLSPSLIQLVSLHISSGIRHLHAHNVIHRDLKSDNIFLVLGKGESVLRCVIGDFDSSKLLEKPENLTHSFVGTPSFLAPEMIGATKARSVGINPFKKKVELAHNNKIDIWGFGMILFEVLCLERPAVMAGSMDKRPRLSNDVVKELALKRFVKLYRQCTQLDFVRRPDAASIVSYLEGLSELAQSTM